MILNLNPSLDYIFLIFPESHANPLSSDVQENLENATNRLAANLSRLGGRKFGKCNKQAGGKLFMVRQQEIWKNETYSSLKFHIKARQQKIWKNKLYMLCSLVILESDRYTRI